MKQLYKFKNGGSGGISAQDAGECLAAIEQRDGLVRPEVVVAEAKDVDHILHRWFTWDDSAAAQKHREFEARALIRNVVIVKHERQTAAQGTLNWVSIGTKHHGSGYINTTVALTDLGLRERVLADAYNALRGWRSRYKHLTELRDLVQAIDDLLPGPVNT